MFWLSQEAEQCIMIRLGIGMIQQLEPFFRRDTDISATVFTFVVYSFIKGYE